MPVPMYDEESKRQAQAILDAQNVSRGTQTLEPQQLQPEPAPSYPLALTSTEPEQPWSGSAGVMQQPAAPALASDAAGQQQNGLNLTTPAKNQLDQMETAYDMQQLGVANATQAGAEKAAAESAYYRQQQAEMQKMQAEQAQREAERQKELAVEQAKLQQSVEEYGNLKVDPKRLYNNMGTGDKVVAAIGLILGAFGRNGNTAVDVLQNAINRDVDAQKADIGVQGDKLNAKKNLYAQMRERFGDERQAEAATRLALIQNSQLKAQEIASKYKAPEIQANAQLLYGQLEAQKQAVLTQFNQNIVTKQMAQRDPTSALIQHLPKNDQENATKELNAYNDVQRLKADIMHRYNNEVKQKKSVINNPYGADQAVVDTFNASIFPAVKKIAGEKLTDGDAKRMIDPHLIGRLDGDDRMDEKMRALLQSLDSVATTPTLDRYQISPAGSKASREKLGIGAPVRTSGRK